MTMQAILATDGTMNDWVLAMERLGPFGIQVVLLSAMVWYLRKHIAALLDSKRKQNDATAKAVPLLMQILEQIAESLKTLLKHHAKESDQPVPRGGGIRNDRFMRAGDGGAGGKDLSREVDQ